VYLETFNGLKLKTKVNGAVLLGKNHLLLFIGSLRCVTIFDEILHIILISKEIRTIFFL
jgi:hypothetical protein